LYVELIECVMAKYARPVAELSTLV